MKKLIVILISLSCAVKSWSWDNIVTHPQITEYVANMFFDIDLLSQDLALDGVTSKARFWIRNGSNLEDQGITVPLTPWEYPARLLNHFHNPTKPAVEQAGLNDLVSGMSAILWAQNPTDALD
jgi:hypothetical protein